VRLLVTVETDLDRRAAQALAADPQVETVLTLGGAVQGIKAWDPSTPIDAVIGRDDNAQRVAAEHGVAAIVPVLEASVFVTPAVWAASPAGLAMAMAMRVEGEVREVALAAPGPAAGMTDRRVSFPRPIGARRARAMAGLPVPALVAGGPGPFGAVLIKGPDEERAVVDDDAFMQAVTLAAGIALLPAAGREPVWSRPQAYLAKVEEMGLRASARRLR
jgi:hypothetical protein